MLLLDKNPEGLWEVDFPEEKTEQHNRIINKNTNKKKQVREISPAAHGQLEKTNLGWPDSAFGMSSGFSSVYGWIRLGELVPTNEFSRPHLLWHATIFKKTLKKLKIPSLLSLYRGVYDIIYI